MGKEDDDLPVSPHNDRGGHLLNELEKALLSIDLAKQIAKEALVAAQDYKKEVENAKNQPPATD